MSTPILIADDLWDGDAEAVITSWLVGDGAEVGQGDLVEPVNRAETADKTPAHRLQPPEIEIMRPMVVARLGEKAVITLCGRFDFVLVTQLSCFGEQSEAADRLHILCATFADQ